MKTLDLNCDMGEGFGAWKMGDDAALLDHVTSANIACGFHAGDPGTIHCTVKLAIEKGVAVGAHPSLPDLQGFGRREMRMDRAELAACILYQVGALKAFLDAEGMPLNHVKPHGALYGMAARDEQVANAVADAAAVFKVPLMGMAGTQHEKVYKARGLPFLAEFYVDLDYDQTGKLIITREHAAVDPRHAVERTLRAVKEGKVKSVEGPDIPMRADCICVHSDTPGAVELARAVHDALKPMLS